LPGTSRHGRLAIGIALTTRPLAVSVSADRPESSVDPPFPDRRHVLVDGCARCPALVDCRERISWGTGSLDASVFVVGEAPGAGDPNAER